MSRFSFEPKYIGFLSLETEKILLVCVENIRKRKKRRKDLPDKISLCIQMVLSSYGVSELKCVV